jgi:alanyl-tRNA synthetase
LIVHFGRLVSGEMKEGENVTAEVDTRRRQAISRAHSATHILHHALQKHLGRHAQQQGSKVEADALRFDFTNQEAVSEETLAAITGDVLAHIASNDSIEWRTVSLAEARAQGAMMLFGEKYPDPVRMVSMGEFSRELCGGTHLSATGQVEAFEVISEESVSSNTRRIVALTGARAEEHRNQTTSILTQLADGFGVDVSVVVHAVKALVEEVRRLKKAIASGGKSSEAETTGAASTPAVKQLDYTAMRHAVREVARMLNVAPVDTLARVETLRREAEQLKQQLESLTEGGQVSADELLAEAEKVGDALIVVRDIQAANPNLMRQWIDQLRKKSELPVAVLLATSSGDDKVTLVAGLSNALVTRGCNAGKWVGEAASIVGGGGGGRPDLAQAGGKDPSKIAEALTSAATSMRKQLGG